MTPSKPGINRKGAFGTNVSLARRVATKRSVARIVLFFERLLPPLLPAAALLALFVSVAWFGLFRLMPDILRIASVLLFAGAFLFALSRLLKINWPTQQDADRLLEARNNLPHQPVAVQEDEPVSDTPFARALWQEHQRRMAEKIAALDAGFPQPDIAQTDRIGLRAIPALLLAIAFAYSGSNGAGSLYDAFYRPLTESRLPDIRIDAWITPPGYTGRAPVFLTGRDARLTETVSVPQYAELTVRISGGKGDEKVFYKPDASEEVAEIPASDSPAGSVQTAAPNVASARPILTARTHSQEMSESGALIIGERQWQIGVIPDRAPEISFDGMPKRTQNGSLEIGFKASDDYGLQQAFAEITPADGDAEAKPLYSLPEYKLDLPRHNARESKGLSSRNLTEHPLAGKKVKVVLVARDGAGQEGRSPAHEMILPGRNFVEPLAAAVAEQRQVFSLDTRQMPRAIALNEALTIRAEETIPKLAHFLLIESARARMKLARTTDDLKDTADYLWEIALGIDDGDLSLAEQRLRNAQKALSEALERNAPDEEIAKLMDELRSAMQEFLSEMAQRMQNAPMQHGEQQSAQNVIRQRDLENMMNQIENLARSGNRDAAQQLLSELQRMMNNLQAGRPQQGGQQQQQNSQMRQQIDKLGELLQQQQRLMDQTFQLDQALKDRMQRGDPRPGENGEQQQGQNGQPQNGQQQTDQMTAEQLREALKQLRSQQQALGDKLKELQEGLSGMGIKPGQQFGEAGREMQGAGEALGKAQGGQAVEGQGRAMEALRQGARDMMNQMMQAMQQGQGQGQGEGQAMNQGNQNGRDPLGRPRQTNGPDFGERVNVPDEIDVQRAREILEAIRRKLDESGNQEVERRYLERLLDLR